MRKIVWLAGFMAMAGCFSGGGDGTDAGSGGNQPPPPPPPPAPNSAPPPTPVDAARFLTQASFGGNEDDIAEVVALGYDGWLDAQMALAAPSVVDRLDSVSDPKRDTLSDVFWEFAIERDDQLRQRVAYALSQIVVVSMDHSEFGGNPEAYAEYMDMLQDEAFGNYTDLIRKVSLSPAMGVWLSHLGNQKADPERNIEPDENYAREVMQLFTIGLVELGPDGIPTDIETYDTDDIRGLARVFTGLSWADTDFERPRVSDANRLRPMESYDYWHESGPKAFLGTTVSAGSDAVVSVNAALDHLLAHDNLAPFISKQLIQRLVASNPSPAYVRRVADAFEAGQYRLSNGDLLGAGRRGDMRATVAAILLDVEARELDPGNDAAGKLREPVLRFAQFARAFRDARPVPGAVASVGRLRQADNLDVLAQLPYGSPSVFNFYRPGYAAAGSETAARGLVAPEMQLATTASVPGYISFMASAIGDRIWGTEEFVPDYADELPLAHDPAALVAHLDDLLTYGELADTTRDRIVAALELVTVDDNNTDKDLRNRVELALLMVVTSAEYMIQR
jgi:uncharacterized protein (DUF1800 family)